MAERITKIGKALRSRLTLSHPPLNPLPSREGNNKRESPYSREGKVTHLK
jgi:hypothetical protein